MIEGNVEIKCLTQKFVIRICDECGKREETRMSIIYKSRKTRNAKIDLCRKCACSSKYKPSTNWPKKEKSHHWKGGIRIDNTGVRLYNGTNNGPKPAYVYEHRFVMEEHLKRKLFTNEIVHHVDMDRLNNNFNNLYLCADDKEHYKCHISMEALGFSLLGNLIWFDYDNLNYTTNKICNIPVFNIDLSFINDKVIRTYTRKNKLDESKQYQYYNERKSHLYKYKYWKRYLHTEIAKKIIGRNLFANEAVHHIDGITMNNSPHNLVVVDHCKHIILHKNMQRLVGYLYNIGSVKFNAEKGIYYV